MLLVRSFLLAHHFRVSEYKHMLMSLSIIHHSTPLFSTGGTGAALFNSALISDQEQKCDIKYRIIGRQALKGPSSEKKPPMSWSVPLGWLFTMPKRCRKDKVLPSHEPEGEIKVLEGFQQG